MAVHRECHNIWFNLMYHLILHVFLNFFCFYTFCVFVHFGLTFCSSRDILAIWLLIRWVFRLFLIFFCITRLNCVVSMYVMCEYRFFFAFHAVFFWITFDLKLSQCTCLTRQFTSYAVWYKSYCIHIATMWAVKNVFSFVLRLVIDA